MGQKWTESSLAWSPQGSWMITHFAANAKFPYAWVPMPKGPSGNRATMLNGLADSIWVGSKNKEEAWKWVKYLGSADCQNVVASYGVVFPAIKGLAEKAIEVQKGKGVNSSAFLEMAQSTTFLAPTTTWCDGGGTYTVVEGDTPSGVAKKLDLSLEALYVANSGIPGTVGAYVVLDIADPPACCCPDWHS